MMAGLPAAAAGADELIAAAEDRIRLRRCVQTLADVQRAVVTLRMLDEVPGDDVAQALGITPGHVAVLLHRASEVDAKAILVTGPGQGEGKSTTTANLGVVLARSGYRVALLSCDLRKPTLHRLFGLPSEPGLADVLQHRISLRDALIRTGVPNLVVLPSGSPPPNPSELLGSGAMAAIVKELRANADFVLLDSPPSLVVGDALELAPLVDGVLVVVDGGTTTKVDVQRLRGQLDQVGGRLLGCVLNNLDRKAASRYGYYYSDAYRYTEPQAGRGRRKAGREQDVPSPGTFPRTASQVNVNLGPAPIAGFDVGSNGNGKAHAPEEAVPVPVPEEPVPVSVPEEPIPVSVPEAVPETVSAPVGRPDQMEGEPKADLQSKLRSVLDPAPASEPETEPETETQTESESVPLPEPPTDRDMWR
jgi:capsular exopolysaccharide synthesis family protein